MAVLWVFMQTLGIRWGWCKEQTKRLGVVEGAGAKEELYHD